MIPVCSVTRFGAAADFADPEVAASLRPFLAALAHVEEWAHPGSLAIAERVLNPRHWAAAGSLGAVHLVADQDPPHPFDEQRAPTVLNKYGAGPAHQGAGQPNRLRSLNAQSLAFTVNGCFTEISSRESINQYYELVQAGLRVQDSFGTVQRALRDAEGMDNDRFQGNALDELRVLAGDLKRLLDEAGHNARLVAHVQSKVEWLEVFFVSYYFTALMYYVSHGDVFKHKFTMWSLILAPLVSGAIAFLGLKPHKLHVPAVHPTPASEAGRAVGPAKRYGWRNWGFLVLLFGAFFFWLSVGWLFF